ncbi:MAG: acetyl/propionyl/methylcrotonyl-CoA carboxylase subunit alpha [Acidimicrobiales bacterium]
MAGNSGGVAGSQTTGPGERTTGPVTKVLVANRGEVAQRVFRTCAEMGLPTVAVFSDADSDAGSPFIREADEAVRLPGSRPGDTYLRGDLIVAAAKTTGADAIHPGYGFLSESAGFARLVRESGLTFVGPSSSAMEAMGSKIAARAIMAKAGVPVLAGAELDGLGPDEVEEAGSRVGYPLLVKASAGGGGRGMRLVRSASELLDAVASASREAASAFGDATVFLERYLSPSRHVEVQVFGDSAGNVISLFERDCSLQRRNQKLVEESPCPVLSGGARARMASSAVAAARAIGYVGAGTVEMLLATGSTGAAVRGTGEAAFLEMNTRLQVEHAVTELVTGLDLVRLQLLVAAGEPLPAEAIEAVTVGHAIEARVYAEDVGAGFVPVAGRMERFRLHEGLPGAGQPRPAGPWPGGSLSGGSRGGRARVDSAVEDGTVITPHYDGLVAKIVVHAPTRREAAARLAMVLARAEVHGPPTNRDLLVRALRHPEFLGGRAGTGFIEAAVDAELGLPLAGPDAERLHLVAAVLAREAHNLAARAVQRSLPPGWRNNPSVPETVTYETRSATVSVAYRRHRDALTIRVGSTPFEVSVYSITAEEVDLEVDGVRRVFRAHLSGTRAYIDSSLGSSVFVEVPRFAAGEPARKEGSLTAPMPGTITRVPVAAGDMVARGQPLVALEAMKMEHSLLAPAAARVLAVRVAVGDRVDAGQQLVELDAVEGGPGAQAPGGGDA